MESQTCWITGATSGLGLALAREYLDSGWKVLASGRNREALAALVAQARPGMACALPFDYEDDDALPETVRAALALGPDLVILNAGASQRMRIRDMGKEDLARMVRLDLSAPIELARLIVASRKDDSARRPMRLVAVSSLAGMLPAPGRAGYAAAKHGLVGFFTTLAAEEDPSDLAVSIVMPGFVRTAIAARAFSGPGGPPPDADIAGGLDPARAARRIADGIVRGRLFIRVALDARTRLALVLRAYAPSLLLSMLRKRGH